MDRYWKKKDDYGIRVSPDGRMTLGGQPLYSAGVNCYNLFNQCWDEKGFQGADKAKRALDVLKQYDVQVVRFNCGHYDDCGIALYGRYPSESLRLLADIAAYADRLQIGLIPSLFWLVRAVPDSRNEPIRAWGQKDSRTIAYMREYTENVVRCLKGYKSIFGWEFGNEFNLDCDLPNAGAHIPALPAGSTRSTRTEEDYLSAVDVSYALTEFSALVKRWDDACRLLMSGNASLRPSQYHQLHERSWEQDSREQYAEMTAIYTPEGMNAVSEHVYFTRQQTFGKMLSLAEYLFEMTAMAGELGKAYCIGEWGGDEQSDTTYYRNIANDIIDAGVQLSLFWNYNLEEGSIEHSFSHETPRGKEILRLIREMNVEYDAIRRGKEGKRCTV